MASPECSAYQAALQRVGAQQARIAKQKELIANLASNGAGVATAEHVLVTMEDTLTALRTSLSQYPDQH
jgi:hypothetical protein